MPKDPWRRIAKREVDRVEAVRRDPDALHRLILKSAQRHGTDSDPDHEIGDLQDALRQALVIMTPTQRDQLYGWWKVFGWNVC